MNDLIFSGIQPSASQVHLGNYLGAMRQFVALQSRSPLMVCIVDFHALTSVSRKEDLQSFTRSLSAAYLAVGLTEESTILFRQSDVPEVCELSWYFACHFPLGLLERAHAFKDKKSNSASINAGLMFYPILMAADILLYKATKVPVGADQKQHVEMTREIAEKFNYHFKTEFPVPEPLISAETGIIPGLDGRKMSKTYDNYIGMFESEKVIKKKINRIVTDSKGVDEPKDPDTCTVFKLYRHFATSAEIAALSEQYKAGGMGYGVAKEELYKSIMRELVPIREKYDFYINNPDKIEKVLSQGAERARETAQRTMREVRKAVGILPSK